MKYKNPVIPGFHPDPSICRVEEDYYLVCSSFNYFPGVPIYHSRDLVHWKQIGHCLTRENQLNLEGATTWGGIYAPTLRYHNGLFYMITTNMTNNGHFFVYSKDPAGEWSDPIFIEGTGFDPDLFFDEDGKIYFTREDFNGYGIRQWEIDINTGKLIGEERLIWEGFEDRLCEGPHIYKINGTYYLLIAEGGTHRGHMIAIARSKSPTGPFEGCPHNPILTHRNRVVHDIQATGHGDLIQFHNGSWWIVFLGIRQIQGYHHLGRETFLAPVQWTEDGWPIINHNKAIELEMEACSISEHIWEVAPTVDDFDEDKLGLCWNFVRNPEASMWSLNSRPGWLQLKGNSLSLNDKGSFAFVGRRQEHFNCLVATILDFKPSTENEEAGLTAFMDEEHHYEIAVIFREGIRKVVVRRRIGDLQKEVFEEAIGDGEIKLQIKASQTNYDFSYSLKNMKDKNVCSASVRYISTEVAGGFTGVYFGLYATGKGRSSSIPAYFDRFEMIIE